MSNERPDDFQAWRSLLGQPDALPEQGLADKDATWERLFERLATKPRRWPVYGIVAACILLALVPAARFFQDRPARTVSRHTKVEPVAFSPSDQRRPFRPAPATPLRRRGLPPSGAAITTTPSRTFFPVALPIRTVTRGPMRTPPSAIPLAAVDHAANPPQITLALAPPKLPVRPDPPTRSEWRVVNLNELNPGAAHPHSMASAGVLHMIRNGLGKPSATGENSTPTSSPPEEDNGLKIKLSAQN
jgi:hypothetical protein